MSDHQATLFDDAPDPWVLDAAGEQVVAEVVFTDPPHGPFDYAVPAGLEAKLRPGQRVQVPLGRGNRPIVGYCSGGGDQAGGPAAAEAGAAAGRCRAAAVAGDVAAGGVDERLLLCPLGQVLQAMVPAGVRGQAGTREMTFLSVSAADQAATGGGDAQAAAESSSTPCKILAASPRPLTPPELAQAAKCTLGPIAELRKKKLVAAEVRRIQQMEIEEAALPREEHLQLNPDQQVALDCILAALREQRHETMLMHGVTGSGKTEVYIQAIEEVVQLTAGRRSCWCRRSASRRRRGSGSARGSAASPCCTAT